MEHLPAGMLAGSGRSRTQTLERMKETWTQLHQVTIAGSGGRERLARECGQRAEWTGEHSIRVAGANLMNSPEPKICLL